MGRNVPLISGPAALIGIALAGQHEVVMQAHLGPYAVMPLRIMVGASAAMASVFGVFALVGLIPLYVYIYFRNLVSVARYPQGGNI